MTTNRGVHDSALFKTKTSTDNMLFMSGYDSFALKERTYSEKLTSRSILKEVHVDLEDDLNH